MHTKSEVPHSDTNALKILFCKNSLGRDMHSRVCSFNERMA